MLFLEEIARPLLSFHMFISLIALAALGFSAYLMYKQNAIDWNSGVKAAWLGTLAYIASFFLGLVIYPVFRVNVRANYFDKSLQWATAIFEIKEHVAALSFFAALALMALLLSLPCIGLPAMFLGSDKNTSLREESTPNTKKSLWHNKIR